MPTTKYKVHHATIRSCNTGREQANENLVVVVIVVADAAAADGGDGKDELGVEGTSVVRLHSSWCPIRTLASAQYIGGQAQRNRVATCMCKIVRLTRTWAIKCNMNTAVRGEYNRLRLGRGWARDSSLCTAAVATALRVTYRRRDFSAWRIEIVLKRKDPT